jgi:hypothetical protein
MEFSFFNFFRLIFVIEKNMCPVRYELDLYIQMDSYSFEKLKLQSIITYSLMTGIILAVPRTTNFVLHGCLRSLSTSYSTTLVTVVHYVLLRNENVNYNS